MVVISIKNNVFGTTFLQLAEVLVSFLRFDFIYLLPI